jgi:hypothetical protein
MLAVYMPRSMGSRPSLVSVYTRFAKVSMGSKE